MLTLQPARSAMKAMAMRHSHRALAARSIPNVAPLALAAIVFAGFMLARLLDRKRRSHRVSRHVRALRENKPEVHPAFLRDLVGMTRAGIAAALGPPRARVANHTWYFPIDATAKTALAIRFDRACAVRARIIQSPIVNRAAVK